MFANSSTAPTTARTTTTEMKTSVSVGGVGGVSTTEAVEDLLVEGGGVPAIGVGGSLLMVVMDSVAGIAECLLSEAVGGLLVEVLEGLMVEVVEGLHGASA